MPTDLHNKTLKLLEAGRQEYEFRGGLVGTKGKIYKKKKSTKKVVQTTEYVHRETPWDYYRYSFVPARDLLIRKGYEQKKPNFEAQELFYQLIPDSNEMKQIV